MLRVSIEPIGQFAQFAKQEINTILCCANHHSCKQCGIQGCNLSNKEVYVKNSYITMKPKASLLNHRGTGLVGSCQCRSSTITLIKMEITVITITIITYIPTTKSNASVIIGSFSSPTNQFKSWMRGNDTSRVSTSICT